MADGSTSSLEKKLAVFMQLTDAERAVLRAIQGKRRKLDSGLDLLREGEKKHKSYILLDGWAASYKLLVDGSRQVINFQIPGDFMGLRTLLLRTSDHNFESVTDIVVSEITKPELSEMFQAHPRLGAAVLWAASRDEAMVVEHLVDLGRRDSVTRTAHFMLELGMRLQLIGLAQEDGFACPLTQYALSDALGLSAIHFNRCLRKLREGGLMSFRDGRVTFHDHAAMVALADFDVSYLDQEGPLI